MRLRRWEGALYGAILIGILPIVAPQLLAFPHSARVGAHTIYSEAPITPSLVNVINKADGRVARSALGSARKPDQNIFLTSGGWRWRWLSLLASSSFALSRPVTETIVINRSDPQHDVVMNGRAIGGILRLHGVIAHEMTHGSIRSHFGTLADWRYPKELIEGYSDYVAGGGSLSDAQARTLERSGEKHPALLYWRGRKQVEAALDKNGGSVEDLFANWPD